MRARKMAKYFLYTFFSLAAAFGLLAIKREFSTRETEEEEGLSSALTVRDGGSYLKEVFTFVLLQSLFLNVAEAGMKGQWPPCL